jgi:hypothetical protein
VHRVGQHGKDLGDPVESIAVEVSIVRHVQNPSLASAQTSNNKRDLIATQIYGKLICNELVTDAVNVGIWMAMEAISRLWRQSWRERERGCLLGTDLVEISGEKGVKREVM